MTYQKLSSSSGYKLSLSARLIRERTGINKVVA